MSLLDLVVEDAHILCRPAVAADKAKWLVVWLEMRRLFVHATARVVRSDPRHLLGSQMNDPALLPVEVGHVYPCAARGQSDTSSKRRGSKRQ